MADFNDYAPVTKAEVAAVAAAPAPAPTAPASAAPSAPARPRPAPPVSIAARSLTIPLQYPIAYDGREFHAITLRRPTSREVGQYFEALIERSAESEETFLFFPVFYAQDGAPVPHVVLANLDDDDRAAVMERVSDFLPRRLQALQAAGPSDSGADTGAATEPTSST